MKSLECKVCFTWEGEGRPFATVYDYEYLKELLKIDKLSHHETYIEEVVVEGKKHEVVDIQVSILKDPVDEELMNYGIEMALAGEPGPYNTRIDVYLKK